MRNFFPMFFVTMGAASMFLVVMADLSSFFFTDAPPPHDLLLVKLWASSIAFMVLGIALKVVFGKKET